MPPIFRTWASDCTPFETDGRTIFATLKGETKGRTLIEDLERGQLVFEKIMRPFFHKLECKNADLVRFWPLSKKRGIVIDPARKFGKPIDADSGISTRVIAEAVSLEASNRTPSSRNG